MSVAHSSQTGSIEESHRYTMHPRAIRQILTSPNRRSAALGLDEIWHLNTLIIAVVPAFDFLFQEAPLIRDQVYTLSCKGCLKSARTHYSLPRLRNVTLPAPTNAVRLIQKIFPISQSAFRVLIETMIAWTWW
jgi:hypothetical protein